MQRLTGCSSAPCRPLSRRPAAERSRRPEAVNPAQPRRKSPLPPAGEGGRRPGEGLKPPEPRHSHPADPQASPPPRRYPVAIRPCGSSAGAHHRRDINDPTLERNRRHPHQTPGLAPRRLSARQRRAVRLAGAAHAGADGAVRAGRRSMGADGYGALIAVMALAGVFSFAGWAHRPFSCATARANPNDCRN